MKYVLPGATLILLLVGALWWRHDAGERVTATDAGRRGAAARSGPPEPPPSAEEVAALRADRPETESAGYRLVAAELTAEDGSTLSPPGASVAADADAYLGDVPAFSDLKFSGRLDFTPEAGVPIFVIYGLTGRTEDGEPRDVSTRRADTIGKDGRFAGTFRTGPPGLYLVKVVVAPDPYAPGGGGGPQVFYRGCVRTVPRADAESP